MVVAQMLGEQPHVGRPRTLGSGACAQAANRHDDEKGDDRPAAHQRFLRSFASTSSAHAREARDRA